MEPLFKTETKCTYEEYAKFYKVALSSYHLWVILVIFGVISLIAGIITKKSDYFAYLFTDIILIPIIYFAFKFAIKKEYNSNKAIHDSVSTFLFYEDYVIEKTKFGEQKVEYKLFYNTIETIDNFYLMMGKNQGYILIKSNMSDDLIKFLRNKFNVAK